MEIKETIFSKSFSMEFEDTYSASLMFMHKLSENYRVYEKKNVYETDGPVKRSTLVFDVVENLDNFSAIRVEFSMLGENGVLYVDISGYFIVKVNDYGFFTEIFTEFYLKNIFPGMRKISEDHMKKLEKEIDKM